MDGLRYHGNRQNHRGIVAVVLLEVAREEAQCGGRWAAHRCLIACTTIVVLPYMDRRCLVIMPVMGVLHGRITLSW